MPEHRGAGDKPIIVISVQGEEKKFHPEEVSSMILLKMKDRLGL